MAANEAPRDEPVDVKVKEFGKYIVADPRICHGKLTIRGTRILVSVVLEQVMEGFDWDTIVAEWHGKVSKGAIRDAVLLARDALLVSTNERRTSVDIRIPFSE